MSKPEDFDATRRRFLVLATLPLVGMGFGSTALAQAGKRAAAASDAPACFNAATLPDVQVSMRETVEFKRSTDPAKNCGGCKYFTGSTQGCGKCQLLLNGPVSTSSVCNSWVKKA